MATEDGWALEVLCLPAQGERRGVLLAGHAMMVDRRSLDRPEGAGMLSYFASQGWEVLAPDLRGRGASGPSVSAGGTWSYEDLVRFDLPACVAAACERAGSLPVVVLGHSLSGHVSIAAAGAGLYQRLPDAHVLLSANMWGPTLEPGWCMRLLKGLSIRLLSLVCALAGCFPARRLRVGPVDEAQPYIQDLIRFWRQDHWATGDGSIDYLSGMGRVAGPVLALVGRADRFLAHCDGARVWSSRIGAGGADFRVVGRGDWGLDFDPDHMELVTDRRCLPLWQEIHRWLLGRLS